MSPLNIVKNNWCIEVHYYDDTLFFPRAWWHLAASCSCLSISFENLAVALLWWVAIMALVWSVASYYLKVFSVLWKADGIYQYLTGSHMNCLQDDGSKDTTEPWWSPFYLPCVLQQCTVLEDVQMCQREESHSLYVFIYSVEKVNHERRTMSSTN